MKLVALLSLLATSVASQSSSTSSQGLTQCAQMCMSAALGMGSNCAGMFTDCLAGQGCPDDPAKLQAAISQGCSASPSAAISTSSTSNNGNGNGNGNLNSFTGNMGTSSGGNMGSSMNTDPNIPFGLPGFNLAANNNNNNNQPTNSNFNSNSNNNFNSNTPSSNSNVNSNSNTQPSTTNPFSAPQTTGQVSLSPFNNSPSSPSSPSLPGSLQNSTAPVAASLLPANGTWPTINGTSVYSSSTKTKILGTALILAVPFMLL